MYKSNIIFILCLLEIIAAMFTYAVPLDMTTHSSSSLTSRSAMPINYNSNEWSSSSRLVKKRGLVNPSLDLTDSEINNPSMVKNRLMIKRDPINYTVDSSIKDPIVHTKRAQKKSRRSIVRKNNDKKSKRNEK